MEFSFAVPTKIFFGHNSIMENHSALSAFGKKALIMTGRHSAKACGALTDLEQALETEKMEWMVFDRVENNPSVETVTEAVEKARDFMPDMVVGIGGGSPIDAAKAVAVLLANSDMKTMELFQNDFENALPIIAVPTTAGTGSEMTPYSVLLVHDKETKLSFGTEKTYPACAFLDAKYTLCLPSNPTVNTAVDAFTHLLEGYLSRRSTVFSDMMALEGLRVFAGEENFLMELKEGKTDGKELADREKLMYASMLGGLVIAQTGVTIVHGMGYCYTYYRGIPHGRANGLLIPVYLRTIYPAVKEKIDRFLKLAGESSMEDFLTKIKKMVGEPPELSDEEIEQYTHQTLLQAGSIKNTAIDLTSEAIKKLWENA